MWEECDMRTQLFAAVRTNLCGWIKEFEIDISANRTRRRGLFSTASACLWRLLLLEAFAAALLSGQPALNLSFENSSGGVPTGWTLSSTAAFQYAVDASTAVDGTQSLRITSLTSSAGQFAHAYETLTASPAQGQMFHLSGFFKTLGGGVSNVYASLFVEALDPQGNQVAYSYTKGSTASSGWQIYDCFLEVPAGAATLEFGVQFQGPGTAWFDKLSIDVNGQPYFPNPTSQQIQWIQANAIPFTSLDPDADFTELMPLKDIVGNAQIVGLGQDTHGTSEFFRMDARLVSFLVQEMGFTVFAMEANMPEAARINDYLLTGIGDPAQLLQGMYFWIWNTQEVLDMIEWMRQYNASGKGPIQFLGFDMQFPVVAMDYVVRFVQQADPSLLPSVNSSYGLITPFITYVDIATPTASNQSQYEAAQTAAQDVVSQLQANRAKYLETMSATEVDWAIQSATIVSQAIQYAASGYSDASRDASMAVNAEWIAAQAPPGSRIILWAHNGHINKEPQTMGGWLAGVFGQDYVTLGTAFHSGAYTADCGSAPCTTVTGYNLAVYPALDSFAGSAEYYFHETGTPQQILNLGLADANDPASSWLLGGLEFRDIGAAESDGIAEFAPTSRLAQDFDGLVFFDQTTATTVLPCCGPGDYGMALAVFVPVTAPCGAIGVPYAAAPAPGNGTPVALPDGAAGKAYTQTLMGGGGTWPYQNWTLTSGALPAGVSLSSDGVISGTPTETGSFVFTAQTTDAKQTTAQGQLQLKIPAHVRDVPDQGPGCEVAQRKPRR
jgi:erythromycin esterase